MNDLNYFNITTIIMVSLFLAPIIVGIISPSKNLHLRRFIYSLFRNIIFLASIILSVYLTSIIRSDNENRFLTEIYMKMPLIQTFVISDNIWIHALFVLLVAVFLAGLINLLLMPVYRYGISPLLSKAESSYRKKSSFVKRMVRGLCQLPKSIICVLVLALLINFCTSYNSGWAVDKKVNQSVAYQFINKNILNPLLNSSIVKKIPVLLNDSFKDASASLQNIHLTQYFNGVALDDAVKSDSEIDSTAKQIVGKETNSKEKAYLIYQWVSKNISYDYNKADVIATSPSSVSSGAIVTFDTRSGICFDYACLYIAMCRAVDVKVRFITGMGYSGTTWGDHAWNQIYSSEENRWINVDTTFGNSGENYFDRGDFSADHRNDVVQEEW